MASERESPLDVEQIVQDVRSEIRRRLDGSSARARPARSAAHEMGVLQALAEVYQPDVSLLRSLGDIYHVDVSGRRRVVGRLVGAAKKIARRLLAPSLGRQIEYNNAVVSALAGVQDQYLALVRHASASLAYQQKVDEALTVQGQRLEALGQQLTDLAARLTRLEEVAAAEEHMAALREQVRGLEGEQLSARAQHAEALQAMRERVSRAERKLRRLLHLLGRQETGAVQAGRVDVQEVEPEFDYFGMEERMRGSEEEIGRRQAAYLDCFRGCEQVLDLACGRGEFLEVLRRAGIPARGVDLDLDMVLACEEKGLAVTRADAFAYLRGLSDGSVGGIFSAQFIEHLEPRRVIELVRLCHTKLRLGAPLVIETVNPQCLLVFAASFYMDFSHVRPIHPDALKFLFEATGFGNIAVRFSSPADPRLRLPELPAVAAEFNRALGRLNDLLYGFQDYAVVGCKPPAAASADVS